MTGLSFRNRPRRTRGRSLSRLGRVHDRSCHAPPRIIRKAPNITTPTMIVPSTMVVTLGSTAASVRIVRMILQDEDRDDRAENAADTAAEDNAAQHDRRHGRQKVGPGTGSPMPVSMKAEAAETAEEAADAVGRRLGPPDGDARAEGRVRPTRWRRSERPSLERFSGTQTSATITAITISALGTRRSGRSRHDAVAQESHRCRPAC
jgi:hypothetical protein